MSGGLDARSRVNPEQVAVVDGLEFHWVAKEIWANVGEEGFVECYYPVIDIPVIGEVDLGVVQKRCVRLSPRALDQGDRNVAKCGGELGVYASSSGLLERCGAGLENAGVEGMVGNVWHAQSVKCGVLDGLARGIVDGECGGGVNKVLFGDEAAEESHKVTCKEM